MQVVLKAPTHHGGYWRARGEVLECPRAEAEALVRSGAAECAPGAASTVAAADGPVVVVVPTYNRVRRLGETLRSALTQTPAPDRIVVVDDGSTDGTRDFLEETAALHYDKVELRTHRENLGVAAARGTGTDDLPAGAIVVELDDHDRHEPGALAAMVEAIRGRGRSFVYGDCLMIDEGGRAFRTFRKPPYVPWQLRDCGCFVAGVRAYRKSLYDEAGRWRPDFGPAGDYDLFLRFEQLLRGRGIESLPQVLSRVRVAAGSISVERYAEQAEKSALLRRLAREGRLMAGLREVTA